jgi:uncharacterized protein YqhQ
MATPRQPRPYIGGQAVLEGVMMRAPTSFAVVVRAADGSLVVRERAMTGEARGVARIPFVRGVASLVEALRLGREALNFSVEQLEHDLASGSAPAARPPGARGLAALATFLLAIGADAVQKPRSRRSTAGGFWMLAMPVALLVAFPQGAAAAINRAFHLGLGVQSLAFQAMTGALKLAIVVGLMLSMRRIPEIRRMFQYHGAEHKTISTYEAGEALTVENARAKTTLHPRCGTTFVVMVALVSIVFFGALGALLPTIRTGSVLADNAVFFLLKLPLLPVLVATTFELQRIFARFFASGPLRVLLWPGFAVQRITTAEPDDAQLEVALASLRSTLFRGKSGTIEAGTGLADVRFPSYEALLEAPALRA